MFAFGSYTHYSAHNQRKTLTWAYTAIGSRPDMLFKSSSKIKAMKVIGFNDLYLCQLMRFWCLLHYRATKVQATAHLRRLARAFTARR